MDVITRAVFGIDDVAGRERLSAPLRRQLDMVANRLTVLMLMLTTTRDVAEIQKAFQTY